MVCVHRRELIEMYSVLAAYQDEISWLLPLIAESDVKARLNSIDNAIQEALSIGFQALIEKTPDPSSMDPI
jgi:hypothetical protein